MELKTEVKAAEKTRNLTEEEAAKTEKYIMNKNKLAAEALNDKPEELTETKLEKVDGGFIFPKIEGFPGDYSVEWEQKKPEDAEPTPAGDYKVIFTPKDKKNYDWNV